MSGRIYWRKVDIETFQEACGALKKILSIHSRLKAMVDEMKPLELDKKGPYYKCAQPNCFGFIHCAGQTILPDGGLGFGCLYICDTCGYYIKKR